VTVRIASLVLLLVLMIGCSSSKPAPKPLSSVPQVSTAEMESKIRAAEAKEPCSAQNLQNASEAQKRTCDPTIGMFDNIKPTQPKSTTSPPKAQTKKVAAKRPAN
jgi:hypothetical protein